MGNLRLGFWIFPGPPWVQKCAFRDFPCGYVKSYLRAECSEFPNIRVSESVTFLPLYNIVSLRSFGALPPNPLSLARAGGKNLTLRSLRLRLGCHPGYQSSCKGARGAHAKIGQCIINSLNVHNMC